MTQHNNEQMNTNTVHQIPETETKTEQIPTYKSISEKQFAVQFTTLE